MTVATTGGRLRREKKVNTWTRNCKVFVKFHQNGHTATKTVTEMQDFERLKCDVKCEVIQFFN